MITIATNTVFIIASLYISILALRKYLKMPTNYEHTLYWGVAFMLTAFVYGLNIVFKTTQISDLNIFLLAITVTFASIVAWWLQLYAVLFVIFDSHNAIIRKKIRVAVFLSLILIFIISTFILLYYKSIETPMNIQGLIGLQVLGIKNLDIYFESCFIVIAFTLAVLLFNLKQCGSYLYLGYLLLGVSHIIQLCNICCYNYFNLSLLALEWGIAVSGVLIMFWEIKKIIYDHLLEKCC